MTFTEIMNTEIGRDLVETIEDVLSSLDGREDRELECIVSNIQAELLEKFDYSYVI